MKTRFWKVYAEGNAYVVVDDPEAVHRLAPWVADGARGLGGDGLLLAGWREDHVAMAVFNRDGTTAAACGNGARAVAALAVHTGRWARTDEITVTSPGLSIRHRMTDDTEWRMIQTIDVERDPIVWEDDTKAQVILGAPHRVVLGPLSGVDVGGAGPQVCREWEGGTNVMFAEPGGPGRLTVSPWERGVGPTLGCATGALAAALVVARRTGGPVRRYVVRQPGATLVVGVRARSLTIEGAVALVAEGTVSGG